MKTTKALTPIPTSPSTSTPSASNSGNSSVQASDDNFDLLEFEQSGLSVCPSKLELEPIALRVVNESDKEKNMLTNLRASFKERHRKRLHEAINVVPPLSKRACLERVQEKLGRKVSSMPVPPSDITRPSSASTVEKEVDPALNGASVGVAATEEVLDQKGTPASAFPPSWDKMIEMLKRVSCFTNAESPSTKMSDFFPLTKRISVNLGKKPLVFISAWLPFGMLESTVSHIQLL